MKLPKAQIPGNLLSKLKMPDLQFSYWLKKLTGLKLTIRVKILGGFILMIVALLGLGIYSLVQLNASNQSLGFIGNELLPGINTLTTINGTVSLYRQKQLETVMSPTEDDRKLFEAQLTMIESQMETYFEDYEKYLQQDETQREFYNNTKASWEAYLVKSRPFLELSRSNQADQAIAVLLGKEVTSGLSDVEYNLKLWLDKNASIGAEFFKDSNAAFQSATTFTLILVIVSVAVALALGIFVSFSISRAARLMAAAADQIAEVDLANLASAASMIAQGDLTSMVSVKSSSLAYSGQDEMGDLARSFNQMIAYLQEMGTAFQQMTQNLRDLIGNVSNNATDLNDSSVQLAEAANQTSHVIGQITMTIQQVAMGISQEAESITNTATYVDGLNKAIAGVSSGAEDQAKVIIHTSQAVNALLDSIGGIRESADQQILEVQETHQAMKRLSEAVEAIRSGAQEQVAGLGQAQTAGDNLSQSITQVMDAVKLVAQETTKAAQAAAGGAQIVQQTAQSMERVRRTNDLLAQRVGDLGSRSAQIGAIVETIEDIASQTNLLALNAAIEAARAGEQGRGFAVVADEVRKLAEKSALATKEISGMVQAIQTGAAQAVDAMGKSGEEVLAATELAQKARESFETIVVETKTSSDRVAEIRSAMDGMEKARAALENSVADAEKIAGRNLHETDNMIELDQVVVERMDKMDQLAQNTRTAVETVSNMRAQVMENLDAISSVAEENAASTDLMTANSSSVTDAIENIASVSEENSAATEEVSAATEEINAQVEELTAAAHNLTDMARSLDTIVKRFTL
ncbi:MAG TPA: methyl-accepting chemotaxis protein [Anaerolineaceae bacterium]|nr:methyl-accepting chemotaxis protein [Anaerolineaceae bacterium]HPN51602.1 methyl-accepting chemotaxis protein [Anaerolineaceae bacterium]